MADNSIATQNRRALRVKEFCALYSISRSTTYKLMAEGKLKSIRVGGSRLIPNECAEALLRPGEGDVPALNRKHRG